ncbi:MAG: hypothetical protein H0V82_07720 [Candidatus Protochlamydia sp.]|nr:hypothetical protein [Candidatus Protochlamydia sp.]
MGSLCLCCSGKLYETCCKIFHDGILPKTALELMRSRYSAYALQKVDYVIDTTHPSNPHFRQDREQWKIEILNFCQNTQFEDLKIMEFIDGEKESIVTFHAMLLQQGKDASFIEKSFFEKINGKWLYQNGAIN